MKSGNRHDVLECPRVDIRPTEGYDDLQAEPAEVGRDEEETMKRYGGTIAALGLLAVILTSVPPVSGAVVTFRARFYSNIVGAAPYNVKIEVSEFSPAEESLKLIEYMTKGDDTGFYTFLRSLNKGNMQFTGSNNMQFTGGLGLNIKFNIAQEYETEKGIRIVLVTESRSVEPGIIKQFNVPWRFLIIFLDLDKNYNGTGKIYEDAAISATPSGSITMASSFSTSRELMSVRLVK
jgi:hypothetical protein